MVISAVGMAICLLCGSCGGKEESRGALEMEGTAGRKAEEASRQVWEEQEERAFREDLKTLEALWKEKLQGQVL